MLIKKRRKDLNLTLLEVAKACDVSEATVSRWESGNIDNMKRSRIAALASILDISPSLIVGIDDEDTNLEYETILKVNIPELEIIQGAVERMNQEDIDKMMRILEVTFEEYFK